MPGSYVALVAPLIKLPAVAKLSVDDSHLYVMPASPPEAADELPINTGSPPEQIESPVVLIVPALNMLYVVILIEAEVSAEHCPDTTRRLYQVLWVSADGE